MPEPTVLWQEPLTAADLLQLGYSDDPMLLEDMSLCQLCTSTCSITAVEQ